MILDADIINDLRWIVAILLACNVGLLVVIFALLHALGVERLRFDQERRP